MRPAAAPIFVYIQITFLCCCNRQLYKHATFIAQGSTRIDNISTHVVPLVKDVHARVNSDQIAKQGAKIDL